MYLLKLDKNEISLIKQIREKILRSRGKDGLHKVSISLSNTETTLLVTMFTNLLGKDEME